MLTKITQPPYIPPAQFDYRRAEAKLAALPEYERAAVNRMVDELVAVDGIGPAFALEIVVRVGRLMRRNVG